jgi:hypothetical protein
MLAGRGSRRWPGRSAWRWRSNGARVITDLARRRLPTDHRRTRLPAVWLDADATAVLKEADAVLSLDWVDLAGTLKAAFGSSNPAPQIIHASLDHHLHCGWSMDYQGLPPIDTFLAAEPDVVVGALLEALQARPIKPDERPSPVCHRSVPPGTL